MPKSSVRRVAPLFTKLCSKRESTSSIVLPRLYFGPGSPAGLSMGASLIAEALLAHYLPKGSWTPLISKLGYSIGFLVVILGRQQLFTENTLTPILPLLQDKTMARVSGVLRLWTIVLISNLAGCLAVAWACSSTTVEQPVQVNSPASARPRWKADFGFTFPRAFLPDG